ncbi:hypothetical protein [Cerasicoccus maritimus]|uniref:hypothetical protein n=1 Tax=Cerasicoccus maritimus TaxID=490089 RepID=UPI002852C0FE|nr:hypothetical protein [Cerasicoccus maritimus]
MYFVRVIVRLKTGNPDILKKIIEPALSLPHGLKLGKLCVDATNERFFAASLKTSLAGSVIVEPVVNSESIEYLGQSMSYKSYLGNLMIETFDDGYIALPNEQWIKDDLRRVIQDKGTFDCELGENGEHGDVFDAIKLSIHALRGKGGPVSAAAAPAGHGDLHQGGQRPGIKNPLLRKIRRKISMYQR